MPTENPNKDYLTSRLWRSHISTTSSGEDLRDIEVAHKEALAAAQQEHERVRESAVRAYNNSILRAERETLRRKQRDEEERLKLEAERAQLALKVLELQRKQIPLPTPRKSTTPPPAAPTPKKPEISQNQITNGQNRSESHQDARPRPSSHQKSPPRQAGGPQPASQPAKPAITQSRSQQNPPRQVSTPSPSLSHNKTSIATSILAPTAQPDETPSLHTLPGTEKYLEIHKQLKQLRAFLTERGKSDPLLKKKMGEMRRGIRKSVGQLTEGRGANRVQTNSLVNTLKDALFNTPSPPVDPRIVMLSPPAPVEGSRNNGDTLPALFIYLLNVFSKALVAQFVDEAGASPKTADPIGVVAVSVFAQAELCWRGAPLIDILICKMRVVCPVLFGIRGSEKTEEGRTRLGWKRGDGADWVSDQVHNTRMTGLGAGYAAISLRDFSKSSNKNPFPPTMYWRSMASIVNTPPEETSSTQHIVLKAMIENYEQRFMGFYGSAARAALQVALVDFPGRAQENTVAVTSLKVLGDKLRKDFGLRLISS